MCFITQGNWWWVKLLPENICKVTPSWMSDLNHQILSYGNNSCHKTNHSGRKAWTVGHGTHINIWTELCELMLNYPWPSIPCGSSTTHNPNGFRANSHRSKKHWWKQGIIHSISNYIRTKLQYFIGSTDKEHGTFSQAQNVQWRKHIDSFSNGVQTETTMAKIDRWRSPYGSRFLCGRSYTTVFPPKCIFTILFHQSQVSTICPSYRWRKKMQNTNSTSVHSHSKFGKILRQMSYTYFTPFS